MKKLKNEVALVLMLYGVVLLLSACAKGAVGCCPRIEAFKVDDPWVCPADCPGGGKTRVEYRVEFWKEDERCPPPNEVKISIKNLTDNVDLPPLTYTNPGTGIYEGVEDIRLEKDTELELTVTGGDDRRCGSGKGKLSVDVVEKGDFSKICVEGPLNCTSLGSEVNKIYNPSGPGVLIDHIENLDSLKIGVSKDNSTDHLPPYHPNGTGLSGLEANGNWSIWLESETDCKIYNDRPPDAQKLCLKVYLKCECE